MNKYICVDIGGTAIKYGILNENKEFLLNNTSDSLASKGAKYLVEQVLEIIKQLLSKEQDIKAVCISTAGMVDIKTGQIIYSGKQIPNYIGTNWKKIIKEKFDLTCEIDNDVKCAGLAEAVSGAGKDYKSVLCLTIGTGIGACLVENGKVYRGSNYSAFEIGYLKLEGGDFQDIASTTALIENYKKATNEYKKEINGKYIFDLAKNGDKTAIEQIDNLIDKICLGVANICYVVNPDIVVLGGGIMEQKEYVLEKIQQKISKYLIPSISDKTKIDVAKHKNNAGMIGAYYHYMDEISEGK